MTESSQSNSYFFPRTCFTGLVGWLVGLAEICPTFLHEHNLLLNWRLEFGILDLKTGLYVSHCFHSLSAVRQEVWYAKKELNLRVLAPHKIWYIRLLMKTRNVFILMVTTNVKTRKMGTIYDLLAQEITEGEMDWNRTRLRINSF